MRDIEYMNLFSPTEARFADLQVKSSLFSSLLSIRLKYRQPRMLT